MAEALYASSESVLDWIANQGSTRAVIAPRQGDDGAIRYEPLEPGDREAARGVLALAGPSLLPPGKLFSPPGEVLFTWGPAEDGSFRVEPRLDRAPRLLAGVHPCDLRAIHLMDRVQADGNPDPHYLARREATAIVGLACSEPCSERCFCEAMGSLDHHEGADVMLAAVDGRILAHARTPLGVSLLADLAGEPCADPEAAWARHRAARPEPFGRALPGSREALGRATTAAWSDPVWTRHTEACLACGTCNLVCPTCYCFDTRDEIDVAHPGCGERCRDWDGCMLPGFAAVAGGHDFRRDLAARQRHRVNRKFAYLPAAHGDASFCVGCGRCGAQCTANIDIFDIARDLLAGSPDDAPEAEVSA